jgi:type IV pilus assembly protein PilV
MQNKSQYEQGFTLVELLIATLILSIGILAWGKTLGGATKNRAISSDITVASELAAAKIEMLAYQAQNTPPESPGNDNSTIQGVNYTMNWTIDRENNSPSLWIINMNVTWQRYGNKSVQYQRIVAGG